VVSVDCCRRFRTLLYPCSHPRLGLRASFGVDAEQPWISCIYFISAPLPPNHRSRGPALAHVRITRADQPSLRILAASISSFSWNPGCSAHQHEKHQSTFKQGSRFSTFEKSSSSWLKPLQTLVTVISIASLIWPWVGD